MGQVTKTIGALVAVLGVIHFSPIAIAEEPSQSGNSIAIDVSLVPAVPSADAHNPAFVGYLFLKDGQIYHGVGRMTPTHMDIESVNDRRTEGDDLKILFKDGSGLLIKPASQPAVMRTIYFVTKQGLKVPLKSELSINVQ